MEGALGHLEKVEMIMTITKTMIMAMTRPLGHLEKDAMAMSKTKIARDSRNDIGIGKKYCPDGKHTDKDDANDNVNSNDKKDLATLGKIRTMGSWRSSSSSIAKAST